MCSIIGRPSKQQHRLRCVAGDAPEPCAHAACHDNCFYNDAPSPDFCFLPYYL